MIKLINNMSITLYFMSFCTYVDFYMYNKLANVYNSWLKYLHGKNGFVEISESSAEYRSENNFVWTKIM